MSKQALVRKPSIMLAEERQPAGLALHRRVPHMVGANWNQKTMPVVFLEQREHPVVPGLCWRHSVCSSLVPWLIRRIQPVFIVLCWEELFRLLLLSSRMHGWQESERLLNIQTSRKPNANRDGPGKSRHDQPLAPKAVCLKINTAGRSGKMVTTKKTIKLVFKHRLFRPACFANTLTIMKPVNRGGHQHPTPASM